MNTWNVHIHTSTQNVHNVHNAHIDNIGIPKHKKHLRLLSSGTKFFLPLSLKVFRHEKERGTIFLRRLFHLPQTTCGTHRKNSASSESQPSSSDAKTQLTDFSQIQAHCFRCVTSFTPPSQISYLGFYFDISEWHILSAHAWTPALMLHLTNPCAKRKVLSLTKPKGKIYKTKSLGQYITHRVTGTSSSGPQEECVRVINSIAHRFISAFN